MAEETQPESSATGTPEEDRSVSAETTPAAEQPPAEGTDLSTPDQPPTEPESSPAEGRPLPAEEEPPIQRLPVQQEFFQGPLELLVNLIAKKDLDIMSISISAITGEYLKVLKNWQEEDLELAGDYLVLAATLVRYKARALLPREEQEEEDEEITDELLDQRRREYERFRQLAESLRERERESSALFPRLGPSPESPKEVIEYTEVSVYDLYRTFQRIIEEVGTTPTHVMKGETFSIDEKMLEIEALLAHNRKLVLTDYLRTLQSKLEIIVVFMALLELVRLHEVRAAQDTAHAEIVLVPGDRFQVSSQEETLPTEEELEP